jgi:cytochrome c oxidase subunit 1
VKPDHELPPAAEGRDLDKVLERTWADPSGFWGWFTHVDHKSIGRRYIITAFVFFLFGGMLAAVMRLQLARPESYVAGGIFLFVSFLLNAAPDIGWFAYSPLTELLYTPTKRADVWAQLITFTEVSGLAVAVSIITTAFKMRTPGMSLNRIPIFVWAEVVISFMVIFAMPSIMVCSTALILDRLVNTHFFDPNRSGDPLLWQHLFWFFAHPEVYIIFIPATGLVATIITTFSRRPVFGYLAIVLSLVSTAFLGFGLWVHHMFATGLPELGESFFTAASIMIAIPTGTQIFCWIATLWSGRVTIATPLLWVVGFFVIFIVGGMTGVMVASVPLDSQLHDTFFVVAHLHYVLIGGAVFPLFGGFYYWFPKITGRMLNARLGTLSFWLFFVGFNLTFFPMHVLGLWGMPRRIYTYPAVAGWGSLNLLASVGATFIAAAVLVFIVDAIVALKAGTIATDNPWNAGTLEWATSSPPPACNFVYPPTVAGRDPLWDNPPHQPVVVGLRSDVRDVLVTHVLDAEPDHRLEFPSSSPWPFWTAVATTGLFIGSIFTPWAVVYGAVPVFITMTGWFWPKRPGDTGTQLWPIRHRTLPQPHEGPGVVFAK